MTNPYITPPRIRAALQTLDLRPTRGMGQNFLTDPDVLATIVAAADLRADDTVLEIGPGLGVLTWELVQRVGRVVAVELDKRLEARLHEEFAAQPQLTIIQGDILDLAPGALLANARGNVPPYKVVANLPYAITSPLLRHLLEAAHQPTLIVVLVQWEVAQRITAQPGSFSMLAHSVQIYAEAEIIARVPAHSFFPAPAVDSAVLRLRVRPPVVAVDDINALLRLVKASFLHARKKLSNALPSGMAAFGMAPDKAEVVRALQDAGVNPDRRADTVTLAEWAEVYRRLRTADERQTNDE